MANKSKPNFTPFGNKKSGPKKSALDQVVSDLLGPSKRPSKRFDQRKDHHDPLKGNRGNGGGKKS